MFVIKDTNTGLYWKRGRHWSRDGKWVDNTINATIYRTIGGAKTTSIMQRVKRNPNWVPHNNINMWIHQPPPENYQIIPINITPSIQHPDIK
jgi:hypothetical protein